MPILSMLDLEQSLKLNQMLIDSNLGNTTNINSLLLKNNATGSLNATVSNNASNAILATAIMQQLQQQQQNLNLNNKFFNNNIILNCIKSNLAANLNSNLNTSLNSTTNSDSSKQINYSRYKTELCRQFNENGECKYGDKCQFAHGMNDLKDVNRHPKYKTDYCKTFHSKGFCPYGPRCHFIHEFYEKNDSNELVKVSGLNCSGSKLKQEKQIKVNVTNINKASLKSPLLNQETSGDYSQILDKQFEAQLTSSLFSTIAEESTPILNENTIASNETKLTAEKSSEKLVDPLDEFNQHSVPLKNTQQLSLVMPNENLEKENLIKLLNKVKLHSSENSSLCSPDSLPRTRTSSSSAASSLSNDTFAYESQAKTSAEISNSNPLANFQREIYSAETNDFSIVRSQMDNFKLKFDQYFSYSHLA